MILKLFLLCSPLLLLSCGTVKDFAARNNAYSPEQELQLGSESDAQLKADAKDYAFLKPSDANYAAITQYVNRIKDKILRSNSVPFENQFTYSAQVLKNDVVNAFATAGGYTYFYFGLMKLLDNEAQLAGVIAHEMGHIASRHVTRSMTAQSITGGIIGLALKTSGASSTVQGATGLAYNLAFMKFGRDDEDQADESGASWMAQTDYNPYEMQGFFKKVRDASRPPEFLSTHPDPDSRIRKIGEVLARLKAPNKGNTYTTEYQNFKRLLQ